METVKALSVKDSHFFVEFDTHTIDVDAIKVILFWNEADPGLPLNQKYEYLRLNLSREWNVDLDLANTYLILEKACSIVADLKKTLSLSQNLKS